MGCTVASSVPHDCSCSSNTESDGQTVLRHRAGEDLTENCDEPQFLIEKLKNKAHRSLEIRVTVATVALLRPFIKFLLRAAAPVLQVTLRALVPLSAELPQGVTVPLSIS